jgi:Arylsulfotransferase (ASST)
MTRRPRAVALVLTAASCLGVALSGCGAAREPKVSRVSRTVSVFPIPGSRVASPEAQIVFRGLSVTRINQVTVTGSKSGGHRGRLLSDSDHHGGSFIPTRPFAPGEHVTVSAQVRGRPGQAISFSFQVAHPVGEVPRAKLHFVSRQPGDVLAFHSRPDLDPPSVRMDREGTVPGDERIFVGPEEGPVQSGAMILDPDGKLVWFHPVPKGQVVSDFRVQRYLDRPVLTFFAGYIGSGAGNGEDHILDTSYRQVAVVQAANGLRADMHEFDLLPGGRALITAYFPVRWADSPAPGAKQDVVLDGVVQEIDVRTGLLLFQWDSLDHVPLSASYVGPDKHKPYDYFHINSVQADRDGNLIISSRNTWTAYKVSTHEGRVLWRLGGKHSTFRLPPAATFSFQHDVRARAPQDRVVSLFDNGAGPPDVQSQSRGLTLRLNASTRTATLTGVLQHSPPLLAHFEGNVQELPDGRRFLGWGQRPYFTEFSGHRVILDGHFVSGNPSYRAYLEPWRATPSSPPALAASRRGVRTTIYASWNGATSVARWRVLAGSRPGALRPVAGAPWEGFETTISVPSQSYVAVQALDADGRVIGHSHTIRVV